MTKKQLTPLTDPNNVELVLVGEEPPISLAEAEELLRGLVRQPRVDIVLEE
jgi:hypothetical protein